MCRRKIYEEIKPSTKQDVENKKEKTLEEKKRLRERAVGVEGRGWVGGGGGLQGWGRGWMSEESRCPHHQVVTAQFSFDNIVLMFPFSLFFLID